MLTKSRRIREGRITQRTSNRRHFREISTPKRTPAPEQSPRPRGGCQRKVLNLDSYELIP